MRFTLANERTLLAWLRTALAFIVAGVAVHTLGGGIPAAVSRPTSAALIGLGAALPVAAYLRWIRNEAALRSRRPLAGAALGTMVAAATVITAVLLVSRTAG